MNRIIIGTTPTITYTFKIVPVSSIVKAVLTVKERGVNIIEKNLPDATVGENTLSWTLTQEETLQLGANKTCTMMLNWKTEDGTRGASEEVSIQGSPNHIREVI